MGLDLNDFAKNKTDEELRAAFDDLSAELPKQTADISPCEAPSFADTAYSESELAKARLTPTCIVENYLYADVAVLSAPGGVGKTTLSLYEMVQIALGRPVHGLMVTKTGWCLLVSAEDRREQMGARLREIMDALELSPKERQKVLERVRVWDVSGEQVRLVRNDGGNVVLTDLADRIIAAYRDHPPILVTFDPLISFGASEALVNDNEQGLVTAARRIIRAFDCCVRLVAHTGKQNARGATLDQYSSRGGSALPDGSRMTAVMQLFDPDNPGGHTPPAGCSHLPDCSITILARPKLSYVPPHLPLIWVRRKGWQYESFTELKLSPEEWEKELLDQVERFVASQVSSGLKFSKSGLEDVAPDNIVRKDLRKALAMLIASGRLVEVDLPNGEQRGRRTTYISIPPPGSAGLPQK